VLKTISRERGCSMAHLLREGAKLAIEISERFIKMRDEMLKSSKEIERR